MTDECNSDGKYELAKENIGKHVRLIKTNDPYTKLKFGDCGVIEDITYVNIGSGFTQVWIRWNESNLLALIPECNDQFEIL